MSASNKESAGNKEKGKVIRLHDRTLRPGEKPEAEESPAEGGGSQGAAEPGARGTQAGGRHGAGNAEGPRDDAA